MDSIMNTRWRGLYCQYYTVKYFILIFHFNRTLDMILPPYSFYSLLLLCTSTPIPRPYSHVDRSLVDLFLKYNKSVLVENFKQICI